MKILTIAAILGTVPLCSTALAGEPFAQTLEHQGITFAVTATNEGSINRLTITPTGLSGTDAPQEAEIDGTVSGAEVGDLDANGFPEIYVYVTSAGSGSYGTLVAYAVNDGKSMTPIFLPPLDESPQNAAGYMGHDEFAVLEGVLGRRFPIYAEGDTNAAPSGTFRQLQYKLTAGEAGWILKLDRMSEF
jgi:hypothetical protein